MTTLTAVDQVSSATTQAMQTLTEQWYNAITTGLGLSQQQFQLYQGPGSVASTSQIMWNLFNAVPPLSLNNYYDPSQANNFASDYNLILTSLVACSDSSFQSCMGDYYMQWMTYFQKNPPTPFNAQTVTALFNQWSMMFAPTCSNCVSNLTKAMINPVNTAIAEFQAANGNYAWNQTIDALNKALASGPNKSFTMNSLTASSNTTHTWASGSTSIFFDLFSFGGGGGYDNLSEKATSAGLNITANFQHVTTFAAGPYASADPNNPILAQYAPWYVAAVLSLAYTTKDNTVWNNQAPVNWDKAFGPKGFLQRMATAVVVADGVDITITSTAAYSTLEQTQITAAANAGFWPFFSASGQGGYTNKVTFNDQGQFTATTHSALGNPLMLGILQSPMSSIF